ncbi:MAG: VOC family protein [Gemmatimonadetes bacterium]|nr:VOC family protein [Gemmatimonadota bacterium]
MGGRVARASRRAAIGLAATAAVAATPLAGQSRGVDARSCRAPDSGLRLDHVPIAVDDLDALADRMRDEIGFSLKPGRPHENGLENRHVKFADGSALELMTVDEPRDALALRYADLIDVGGGGAYLALSGRSVDELAEATASIEPALEITRSPAFDWAAFPAGHDLHPVFFLELHDPPSDRPEHVTHENGALRLEEAWVSVEEPGRLVRLLVALGGRDCGMAGHPEHLYGRAVGLASGMLIVVDAGLWMADPESAPVVSVAIGTEPDVEPTNWILGEAGGLWIALRPAMSP